MKQTQVDIRNRNRRTLWLVVGIVLIVGGGTLMAIDFDQLRAYRSRRSWPTATATIIVSTVVGERAFRPNLVYEYSVDSVVHTDSSFLDMPSFGGRRSRLDAAAKKAAEYPVGARVPVHYDPNNPAESHLRITAPWSIYGQVGFSGFLITLGLVAGVAGFRRKTAAISPK